MQFLVFLFLAWRIGLSAAAWIGSRLLPFAPRFPYAEIYLIPSGFPDWIWAFANFDGVHYMTIAKSGYSAQFTQVFFPLYPLLIRVISWIFPFMPLLATGLFVSNVFFALTMLVFWKLIRMDYSGRISLWTLLFFAASPVSFFFGSFYTESLFLFLALSSFYLARRRQWRLASVVGALASLTRIAGIFLLPALLWEWHKQKLTADSLQLTAKKKLHLSYGRKIAVFMHHSLYSPVLYIVPLGLIGYMVYLQAAFGDALYFWHAQPVFGASRAGSGIVLLPQVLWRYGKMLTSISYLQENFWIVLLEVSSTLACAASLIWAHKQRIRLSYLIFSWLAITVPTLTGTFSSMPRYVSIAFPLYIVMGMIKPLWVRMVILILSTALLSALTVLFTRGHWVS